VFLSYRTDGGPFLLVSFLPPVGRMAPANHRHSHRVEVLIGRSAALCVHPLAAWRSPAKSDRAMLLISYFALSYVVIFGLLHAISA
jgi:hypothetical protein